MSQNYKQTLEQVYKSEPKDMNAVTKKQRQVNSGNAFRAIPELTHMSRSQNHKVSFKVAEHALTYRLLCRWQIVSQLLKIRIFLRCSKSQNPIRFSNSWNIPRAWGGSFGQNKRDKNFNQRPLNQIYTDESPHDEITTTTDDGYYIESLFVVTAEAVKLLNTFSESFDLQRLFEKNFNFSSCEDPVYNIKSDVNLTEQLNTTFRKR